MCKSRVHWELPRTVGRVDRPGPDPHASNVFMEEGIHYSVTAMPQNRRETSRHLVSLAQGSQTHGTRASLRSVCLRFGQLRAEN